MDHQTITAERGRRAADLREAAIKVLERQSIAEGTLIDIDDDTCVAAGPKAAILMLLSGAAQPVEAAGSAAKAERLQVIPLAEGFSLRYEACTTGRPGWVLYGQGGKLVRALPRADVEIIEATISAALATQPASQACSAQVASAEPNTYRAALSAMETLRGFAATCIEDHKKDNYPGHIGCRPQDVAEMWAKEIHGIDVKDFLNEAIAESAAPATAQADKFANVWNDALEEAALICDQQANEPECPERAAYCAGEIRALKSIAPTESAAAPADRKLPEFYMASELHPATMVYKVSDVPKSAFVNHQPTTTGEKA